MNETKRIKQTKITRAIITASIMVLEYGGESILVERTAKRLAKSFGLDSVEISMIPSAIVLTTLCENISVTSTRRIHHKPIDVEAICKIQDIITIVEKKGKDEEFIIESLRDIKTIRYNRWLVATMVGFGCASFSHLSDGDWGTFFITFLAAFFAMLLRQELGRRKYMPIITFGITAFFATVIASLSQFVSQTPNIALASSVLLLFPGFPFINSVLDSFKGYISMGWGRWLKGSYLTFVVALGVILAMSLLNLGSCYGL